jgi:hypothetical protein
MMLGIEVRLLNVLNTPLILLLILLIVVQVIDISVR